MLRGESILTGAPHSCSRCGGSLRWDTIAVTDGNMESRYVVGTKCGRCSGIHTYESDAYETEAEAKRALEDSSFMEPQPSPYNALLRERGEF